MDGPVKGKPPFYSLPQRLTMQTPCEIIREARMDVMGVKDERGIRPVQTNRPFTPKDRERVLFGATRKGTRPPSAVNLSYLRRTETTSVKLPTIPIAGKRATTSRHPPRSVLSLDNLVEEYEDDHVDRNFNNFGELPGLRKSYSSPQERLPVETSPKKNVLHNYWTSDSNISHQKLPKQTEEPKQKKKVHRLTSLPSKEEIPEKIAQEECKQQEDSVPIEKTPETEQIVENFVEKVEEKEIDNDDDMVAVLSEGKLVWEPTPPKRQPEAPPASEPTQKPQNFPKTNNYLQNMRSNLNKVQGQMDNLHEQIEQLGERVSSGRIPNTVNSETTFHMNNNKRYHVSKSGNANTGVKAYKKWTENVQEPEEKPTASKYDTASWDFFWKHSYFRSKEENLRPELQSLSIVLEELRSIHNKEENDEKISEAQERFDKIYIALKEFDGFSQGGVPASFKSKLLQTLYMYADDDKPRLLLLIARLVLALRVDSGLPAACKMIFKVARTDSNDHLFIDIPDVLELFLDGIGRASPLDAAESCIYGYGALKFLTNNCLILAHAVHLGALDLVTLHLKMVNCAQEDGSKVGEQSQHAIFQLTGALRNIADGDGIAPLFLTTNCIPTLIKTLLLFRSDEEIVCNIARTLSSLSSDEDLINVLSSVDDLAITLVDLLKQYQKREQIVIRLGYTLGNILATNDLARVQLSRNENALSTLLYILQIYIDKKPETDEEKNATDDVIVKVIRVVANMSMNPVVGNHLSAMDGQLAGLLRILVTGKDGAVLLAALGCLNNLSYYVQAHICLTELTKGILNVLNEIELQDCVVEACRVLGNLTRHKHSRDVLFEDNGLETLERVLGVGSDSVARSVCGVLVNMLLDQETRLKFLQRHGIDKLVLTLERFSGDWMLASLVCRAIWNACATDIAVAVAHNNMDQLLTTLANFLEEENWADGDAEWEEFAAIATDLLERFNAHLESTND